MGILRKELLLIGSLYHFLLFVVKAVFIQKWCKNQETRKTTQKFVWYDKDHSFRKVRSLITLEPHFDTTEASP